MLDLEGVSFVLCASWQTDHHLNLSFSFPPHPQTQKRSMGRVRVLQILSRRQLSASAPVLVRVGVRRAMLLVGEGTLR